MTHDKRTGPAHPDPAAHRHSAPPPHPDAPTHAPAHGPHDGPPPDAAHGTTGGAWATAARATLHCLTGCSVGEVLGMVAGTAFGWGNVPTTLLAIVLAFFFGYLLTLRGVLGAGAGLRTAVRVALAADTVSIAVMELVDNGTIVLWPAASDAGLADALFWISLAVSLAVAFVITTPVNHWMIGRGRGHAVAHRYHH